MLRALRTIFGIAVGYGVMVVLITLVQESWFGGVSWGASPPSVLAIAGVLTAVSAAVGCGVAMLVAGTSRRLPALVMSLLVCAETTALVARRRVTGPLWFDVTAALSLIAAFWIGAEVVRRYQRGRPRPERA